MAKIRLPIGYPDFRRIREDGCYYVDKSHIISSLIESSSGSVLFTRPRRFGKTTVQTMLRDFFDIRMDSRALFEGLAVMSDEMAVSEWMNKYPVIYLTLKDVEGLSFDDAVGMLSAKITALFRSYSFIDDGNLGGYEELFRNILNMKASMNDLKLSVGILAELLHEYYSHDVIVLIDEYDVPLAKAETGGYYKEMLSLLRVMLASVLKDNPHVRMSILTGCLRVSKESLFTGLNNLSIYSVTSPEYADAFGFTESEVDSLLAAAGLSDKKSIFAEWYDGYVIGSESLYTPWDVLQYANALIADSEAMPRNYWANTSGNEVIRKFLEKKQPVVADDFGQLLSGNAISKKVTENLTYDSIYDDENSIWGLMLETGYLTMAGRYQENGEISLRIPNEEIRNLFISEVDSWFRSSITGNKLQPLIAAIWKRDAEALSDAISDFLFSSISYHDYSEAYYHAFLAGLLSASGLIVKSNRESGEGRPDISLFDPPCRRAAVFEIKAVSDTAAIQKVLDEARAQSDEKLYGFDFEGYREIVRYAIAFCRKSAKAICLN